MGAPKATLRVSNSSRNFLSHVVLLSSLIDVELCSGDEALDE